MRWSWGGVQDPKVEGRGDLRVHLGWIRVLTTALIVGFVVVVAYGFAQEKFNLGIAVLLSGSCVMVGGLLGFLFGIPKALQLRQEPETVQPTGQEESRNNRQAYRANTNLEEVSDWLTKILVGVGLTQLNSIPTKVVAFGAYFGKPLGGDELTGERFAAAVLLYFSVTGFLLGYLWTRLFLGGALARADEDALTRVEQKLDAAQLQIQADATALALVGQQLQPRGAASAPVDPEQLKKAIVRASEPVRVQIFYQSEGIRRENWRSSATKPIMERTIPIFEGLIAADVDRQYQRNYAQLGFALKDKRDPEWKKAEAALTTAIQIRGDAAVEGFPQYEFNRAICRIMIESEVASGSASTPAAQAGIRADLRVAADGGLEEMIERTPEITRWRELNVPK